MIKLKYLGFSIFIHFFLILFFIFLVKAQIKNVSSKYIELNLEWFSVLKGKFHGSGKGKKRFRKRKILRKGKIIRKEKFKPKPIAKQKIKVKEKKEVKVIKENIKKDLISKSIAKETKTNTSFNKENTTVAKIENKSVLRKNTEENREGEITEKEIKEKGKGGIEKGEGEGEGEGVKKAVTTFLLEKFHIISKIVQKNIKYPFVARRMGWEGKVLISFLLTKNGEIKYLKVEKSSGYKILDENALKTIKRCSKYFPIPPVDVKIKLPIVYKLE